MDLQNADQLLTKKCLPCEGGLAPYSLAEAQGQVARLEGWVVTEDGQRIRKEWTLTNFLAGMAFLSKVAQVAEEDGHHPDLHLTQYRQLAIELWTHAIGGLSENDFILAAKIDQLPIELKS